MTNWRRAIAAALLCLPSVPRAAEAYCVYLSNVRSGTVSVIDTAKTQVVATVDVGQYPTGIAVAPDGRSAYVANNHGDPGGNTVSVINTSTNTVTHTIPVCTADAPPFWLAITPNGRSLHVTCPRLDSVAVIDTASNTGTNTLLVGDYPLAEAATPDGRFVYVANCGVSCVGGTSADSSIVVIDTATNAITARVPAGKVSHGGLAVSPDSRFVYVTSTADPQTAGPGNVSVIDTLTNRVAASIAVGDVPIAAAVTPDGRWVYVTNLQGGLLRPAGDVSVIDTGDHSVIASIPTGNNPFGVAITPDGRFAYVANSQLNIGENLSVPGDVSVIDTGTRTVVATIPVGNNPIGVAVASVPEVCPEPSTPTQGVSPTPQKTPTPPATPTGTPVGTCAGDCDGSGNVVVNELVAMVDITLGNAVPGACPTAHCAGAIDIACIIAAVNNALGGCPRLGKTCAGIASLRCGAGEVCDLRDPTCAIVDLGGVCVEAPGACLEIYQPVCACDGVTYTNDCERLRVAAVLRHAGSCATEPP